MRDTELNTKGTDAPGLWPSRKTAALDWLMNETHSQRFIDKILAELCLRLAREGIPVARSTIHFRTNHPQWLGARILWRSGWEESKIDTFAYGVEKTPEFLLSPANEIYEGVPEVRERLESPIRNRKYPLFTELRAEGLTDYVAWPLEHTMEKRHIVTFASDRPGGFTEDHLAALRDILPPLAQVSEVRVKNRLARTLLGTYVGSQAGAEILAGATTRGSGKTIEAAIMIADLRDFTAISDLWPRDDVIDMLNGYFDALAEPIEENGGEILKFMGDGLLAIVPLETEDACRKLLAAALAGMTGVEALNAQHRATGKPLLRYGVGLHVGSVMYGNIGSKTRLDFTAIGPAVNVASRLEALTKEVHSPALMSKEFVDQAGYTDGVVSYGLRHVRGVQEAVEIFGLEERARTSSG